jgi:hypothetical protein
MRALLLAATAVASLTTVAPVHASAPNCVTEPEQCYVCYTKPCYPQDYPPFLLEKLHGILDPITPAPGPLCSAILQTCVTP